MCVTTNATTTLPKSQSTRNFSFIVMTRPPTPLPICLGKCLGGSRDPPRRALGLSVVRQRRRRRLGAFVANQTNLGQQVGHLHSGERLEQRRPLRCDFTDVAGQLVSPGCIPV